MSRKLPVDSFKWRNDKFNFYKDFIQNHYESSTKGCILEFNFEYPKELQKADRDLPFLPEKMKIGKCEKTCV